MKTAFALVALAAAATAVHAQSDVAYWSFNDQGLPSGVGFGYLPDEFPFPAEFGDQAGSATIELIGGILDETTITTEGDEVLRWVQSFSGTDIGAQFGEGSGGSLAIQGGTDQLNNGAQVVVSFDASDLSNLSFQFDGRRTSTGFAVITIDLFDGDSFVALVESSLDLPGSFGDTLSFDISALDGIEDARIVFTIDGATSTSGNMRTDNWFIQGDGGTGPCRADLDGDGMLTIFDFLQFQNLFDSGDLAADFDGDGSLTIFDFLEFQNEFDAGC